MLPRLWWKVLEEWWHLTIETNHHLSAVLVPSCPNHYRSVLELEDLGCYQVPSFPIHQGCQNQDHQDRRNHLEVQVQQEQRQERQRRLAWTSY